MATCISSLRTTTIVGEHATLLWCFFPCGVAHEPRVWCVSWSRVGDVAEKRGKRLRFNRFSWGRLPNKLPKTSMAITPTQMENDGAIIRWSGLSLPFFFGGCWDRSLCISIAQQIYLPFSHRTNMSSIFSESFSSCKDLTRLLGR